MLSKFARFITVILISALFAISYGIVHDQITYSISSEYFTEFKFYQFSLIDAFNDGIISARQGAVLVALMATWWIGVIFGSVLALTSLFSTKKKPMLAAIKHIGLVLSITAFFGLIGYTYGKFYRADVGAIRYIPESITDIKNYITVGCMHDFSYAGSGIGLLVLLYITLRKKSTQIDIA